MCEPGGISLAGPTLNRMPACHPLSAVARDAIFCLDVGHNGSHALHVKQRSAGIGFVIRVQLVWAGREDGPRSAPADNPSPAPAKYRTAAAPPELASRPRDRGDHYLTQPIRGEPYRHHGAPGSVASLAGEPRHGQRSAQPECVSGDGNGNAGDRDVGHQAENRQRRRRDERAGGQAIAYGRRPRPCAPVPPGRPSTRCRAPPATPRPPGSTSSAVHRVPEGRWLSCRRRRSAAKLTMSTLPPPPRAALAVVATGTCSLASPAAGTVGGRTPTTADKPEYRDRHRWRSMAHGRRRREAATRSPHRSGARRTVRWTPPARSARIASRARHPSFRPRSRSAD